MPDSNLQSSQPSSICVVRLSAIGDTCHALCVIRRLQDNWPDAKLTWIIGKTEASLMADVPGVEFIIFDKSAGRDAYRHVRDQLRGTSFDAALCMHASMRANRLYRSINAPLRLGFDFRRARDFQWLFTNQRIAAVKSEHALEAMMGFATAIGAEPKPMRWDIPFGEDERQFAADFRSPGMPLVVISPCSSQRARNFRNWSIDNYRAVISHLRARGSRVIISGGPSELEKDYGAALASDGAADNLVGQTTLKQLVALFDAADLVICPDSGPAHMATAMNTPVLGLYATSNPARTGPYVSRELTVNRYPEAVAKYIGKPLEKLRWGQRVRHPDAMDLISIEDVTAKIDAFFDAR
ncbi:MAG: glycosyltransferase family 9 protein [Pseudomonadota bacterium]